MSSSNNKSLATFFLILLIVIIALQFMPFLIGPFHIFPHFFRGIFSGFGPDSDIPMIGFYTTMLIPIVLFVLWLVVTIWVYKDAEERGMNGLLWALLVFVGNIIGLIVYLIVRAGVLPPVSSTIAADKIPCPNCGKTVNGDFAYCPYCGTTLREKCPSCGKEIQPDWKICPHCGEKLEAQ